MGRIKCEYNWQGTNRQVFYDGATFETLMAMFPVAFCEDFLGASGSGPFDGTVMWGVVDVGDATEAIVDDSANGQFLLHLHATSEAEDAVLYMSNNKTFDVGSGLIFECRLDMAVVPGTGVCAVFGMCGDHNLDKDSATEQAWFRLQASAVLLTESDDTTNNNDDTATGITLVAGTYNIFRIDFTDISDVKFFVDGVRVSASTTFDMSNLTAGEQQMQPYFSLDKASGTALGDLNIDYVKIWSDRS
ncbi:MAG: hypothetical protein IMF18_06165 [Proteobacteria bacterium]|nr:hypothetical protein [Pseudomonadota bacterium]